MASLQLPAAGWTTTTFSSPSSLLVSEYTPHQSTQLTISKGVAVTCSWTFVVTYLIMFIINLIPGCHFRSSEEAEIVGQDEVELGEYVADYAYHERDLEGNYFDPQTQPPTRTTTPPIKSSTPLELDEKASTSRDKSAMSQQSSETRTVVTDLDMELAVQRNESRSRSRGRSRPRGVRVGSPVREEGETGREQLEMRPVRSRSASGVFDR